MRSVSQIDKQVNQVFHRNPMVLQVCCDARHPYSIGCLLGSIEPDLAINRPWPWIGIGIDIGTGTGTGTDLLAVVDGSAQPTNSMQLQFRVGHRVFGGRI